MDELTEFERERLVRIQANKRKLEESGALHVRDELLAAKTQKAFRKVKEGKPKGAPGPQRSSIRTAGKKVDYDENKMLRALVQYEEKSIKAVKDRCTTRQRGGKDSGGDRSPAWHLGIPTAPSTAQDKAREAAVKKAENLEGKHKRRAFIKRLSDSMVSGGGWLQAVQGMADHFLAFSDITFTVGDDTASKEVQQELAKRYAYTQAQRNEAPTLGDDGTKSWCINFIAKQDKKAGVLKGGHGFSKNWKGFAVDLFLHPGDWLVFEVVMQDRAVIHIFRAWDFASEEVPKNRFTSRSAEEGQATTNEQPTAAETTATKADAAAVGAAEGSTNDESEQQQKEDDCSDELQEPSAGSQADRSAQEMDADDIHQTDQVAKPARSRKQRKPAAAAAAPAKNTNRDGSVTKRRVKQHTAAATAGAKTRNCKTVAEAAEQELRTAAVAAAAAAGTKTRKRKAGTAADAQASSGKQHTSSVAPAGPDGNQKRRVRQGMVQQQQVQQGGEQQQQQQAKGKQEHTVNWILGTQVQHRKVHGKLQAVREYQVRWLGYDDPSFDTWEPENNFPKPLCEYDWGTLQSDGTIKRLPKSKIPKEALQ